MKPISQMGACGRCTDESRVYFSGRRWLCLACWKLLFRHAPEDMP